MSPKYPAIPDTVSGTEYRNPPESERKYKHVHWFQFLKTKRENGMNEKGRIFSFLDGDLI